MRLRPALVLAAPIGVLAGHALGHLVAPGDAGAHPVDHRYLTTAAVVAGALALLAVAWAGARGRDASRPVPVGALLAAQCVLFGSQEALEHALAGNGPAAYLQSPSLWLGMVAQVATALALVLALRVAVSAGARLAAAVPIRTGVPGLPVTGPCVAALRWQPLAPGQHTPCLSRGPPALRTA